MGTCSPERKPRALTAHPKLISFIPVYLQVRLLLCHPTLTSFILVSNFCASSTMEKSMSFLNQQLFLIPPFHSYSSSCYCKNILISHHSCTQYYLFSLQQALHVKVWKGQCESSPHHLFFPLFNSLHVFPQLFFLLLQVTLTKLFIYSCEYFLQVKRMPTFPKNKIKLFLNSVTYLCI